MRLTILGCQSPYPGPNGATAGYLIQTDETNVLLDCGSGVLSQLTKYIPIYQLDAVILSHFHHDHIADLGVLQYAYMVHQKIGDRQNRGILNIYAPDEPVEQAKLVHYKDVSKHVPIEEGSTIQIGDLVVEFLKTDHPIMCLAMKITHKGKIVIYGADSGLHTEWMPFCERADAFICEGTYLEHHNPPENVGHLKVREAAEIAEKIGCKRLIITHLFPAYKEEEVKAETKSFTSGDCHIAKVGLQLEV